LPPHFYVEETGKEFALHGGAPPATNESDEYEEDHEESEPIASVNGIFINSQPMLRDKHAAWKHINFTKLID